MNVQHLCISCSFISKSASITSLQQVCLNLHDDRESLSCGWPRAANEMKLLSCPACGPRSPGRRPVGMWGWRPR
eukprot:763793-Hanusia_phi.AAC.1